MRLISHSQVRHTIIGTCSTDNYIMLIFDSMKFYNFIQVMLQLGTYLIPCRQFRTSILR